MARPIPTGEVITAPLRDGRRISGAIFGDIKSSRVIFYFNGFPGTRLEATLAHDEAVRLGLKIIALDRPGLGESSPKRGRLVMDWPKDVEEVATLLNIDKFAILAVSGGAMFALATAAYFGERVQALAIVSGVAEGWRPGALKGMHLANRGILEIGLVSPILGRCLIATIASVWRFSPLAAALWFRSVLSPGDVEIVKRPSVTRLLMANIAFALKQGIAGVVDEYSCLVSKWGIPFERISAPSSFWHGTADSYVPFKMAQINHELVPGSALKSVPGAGHFMMVDCFGDVLRELSECARF